MSVTNTAQSFNPDPIIEAVNRAQNLFPYHLEEKSDKWISDGILSEMETWKFPTIAVPTPMLITAAPGTGKSTFILNELADYAYQGCRTLNAKDNSENWDKMLQQWKNNNSRSLGDKTAPSSYNVLLLSNRWTLNLQQKMHLNRKNGETIDGSEIVEGLLQFRNILVATYQGVLTKIPDIRKQGDVAFVVFDEAHFFSSDATFIPETSRILQGLLEEFRTSYRIYITATPEEVKPIIALEEFNLRARHLANAVNSHSLSALGQTAKIIEYRFKADYKSRIQLNFFHNKSSKKKAESDWIDIIEAIRNDKSPDKWLLFVSRKEIGQAIQKELGSSIAEYIDASYREAKSKEIMDMTRREMFEAKVLITTSFLYNGINFHDKKLKNIVMEYTDRTSIIQALGRKRLDDGEKVKVYIKVCSRKELETNRDSTQNQYGLTQEFRANPSQFIISKWGQLPQNQMKMFAPVKYDPCWVEKTIQNEINKASIQLCLIQKTREISAGEKGLSDLIRNLHNLSQNVESLHKQWTAWWSNQVEDLAIEAVRAEAENMAHFTMSDYAPYQLSKQIGNYERLIDQIVKEETKGFQNEICRWFGLEYDESMDFAKTQREERAKTNFETAKVQVLACVKKFKSPMDESTVEVFANELYKIVDDAGLKNEANIRSGKNRTKANINSIFSYFSINYKCVKGKGSSNTWTLESGKPESGD